MLSAAPLDIMCLLNYYLCDKTYHNHGLLTAVQGVSNLLDRDLFKATLSLGTIMLDSGTIVNTFFGRHTSYVIDFYQMSLWMRSNTSLA